MTYRIGQAAAFIAGVALVSVFQNCVGLNSPGTNGSSSSAGYSTQISAPDVNVAPGQVAVVNVTLSKALSMPVTVTYTTLDDSAVAGIHYQTMAGTIDLPAGQMTFSLPVTTLFGSGSDFNNKRFKFDIAFAGTVAPRTILYITFSAAAGPSVTSFQKSSNSGLLAVGQIHSCAVKTGALYCWGYNGEGALGSGNATNRSIPTLVAGMDSGVEAVSAGRRHTCAIKNGALSCWGINTSFELGDGTATNSTFPKAVFDMGAGVQAVSAGYDHTCAIKSGALYCWGNNPYGNVGHNNGDQQVPYRVPGFETGVTAVAAALQRTCAIKNSALYCWGYNGNGELGLGTTVTDNNRNPTAMTLSPVLGFETTAFSIASNDRSSCAVKMNGSLYCWGWNNWGQLGIGTTVASAAPNLINGFDSGVGHSMSTVSHSCAIKASGLHCWGYNGYGQLGQNNTTQITAPPGSPVVVTLQLGEAFVHVAGGGHNDTVNAQSHSCARTNLNRVFCWGYNGYGQIGDNTTAQKIVPVLVGL